MKELTNKLKLIEKEKIKILKQILKKKADKYLNMLYNGKYTKDMSQTIYCACDVDGKMCLLCSYNSGDIYLECDKVIDQSKLNWHFMKVMEELNIPYQGPTDIKRQYEDSIALIKRLPDNNKNRAIKYMLKRVDISLHKLVSAISQ